jgi:hypothetical protein
MKADAVADAPTVLVTAVGAAEGSRGAAAALACAGADVDLATLLVEAGGRAPRPTLLASTAAQRLEERLVAHLPTARVAARGQICQLVVPAGPEGLEMASAAVTVARGALAVVHAPGPMLRQLLDSGFGLSPTGALLRAEMAADRDLLALVARDLIDRGLALAVLKQRLSWVAERRALFGALAPDAAGGLPSLVVQRLLSHACYGLADDAETDPARTAQPEWRDHAGVGSR